MPEIPNHIADDIVFADRRSEPRIVVSLAGRYALATRLDTSGRPREFACRIVSISTNAVAVLAPVVGAMDEPVIAHCDEFGKLGGEIIQVRDRGFVMSISASDDKRTKLAAKIDWYENYKNHDLSDRREQKRIVPKDPRSIFTLSDGSSMGCFIIDISASGIAVSADIKPETGSSIVIGKMVGRVVRHFATGFAVQFIQLQNLESIEQRLKKSPVKTYRS